MLQFYDKALISSALAFAALSGSAIADTADAAPACDLGNGYSVSAPVYAAEAQSCLEAHKGAFLSETEDGVRVLTERHRARLDLAPLGQRASLDEAARAHALDMAARRYAAHNDPEGRGHLDRIRTLDRSVLVGAVGANLTAGALGEPSDAYNALIIDEENRNNLARDMFTHMGVGAAEADDGTVYVVQLFAQVDGELETPMPAVLPAIADLKARFAESGFTPVCWTLEDENGRTVSRGFGEQIRADLAPGTSADLFIEVSLNPGETYALKGPRVSGR